MYILVEEQLETDESIFRKCNSRILQELADIVQHYVTAVL